MAIVYNTAAYLWISRRPLLEALLAEGYRVIAIAPAAPEASQIEELGIPFFPTRYLDRRGTNPWRDVLFFRELRGIYRQESVAVALHFTIKPVIYGSLAARFSGVQAINTITGLGYSFIKGGWIQLLVKRLYRLALAKASRTLFQNPDDEALFLHARLVDPERIGRVPGSGIDTDFFQSSPLAEAAPLEFVFIGRLLKDKGVREFVAAAQQLRDENVGGRFSPAEVQKMSFSIVGGIDPDNPAAINAAELDEWQRSAAVNYRGTTTDVRSHIIAATAVVLPSYREGLPRVLLEGAACGRPLIATDVPGCREVVVDGSNGYLVPARDVDALAQTMLRMAQLPATQREVMGQVSRQLAEARFAATKVVKQYIDLVAGEINAT